MIFADQVTLCARTGDEKEKENGRVRARVKGREVVPARPKVQVSVNPRLKIEVKYQVRPGMRIQAKL